jgi:tryptophan halogenase
LLEDESFREDSWAAVLTGLGVWPRRISPQVERLELARVEAQAGRLSELIGKAAASLPDHQAYLNARRGAAMAPAA